MPLITKFDHQVLLCDWRDVRFRRGFWEHQGREIPCYEFMFPEKVQVVVYGSFMDREEDWGKTTLLVWKSTDVALQFETLAGLECPSLRVLLPYICQDFYPLRLLHRPDLELKGDLAQTVFQRVKDDPDLLPMIREVKLIRGVPEEALKFPEFWSGFLRVLLPAVRHNNFEKIKLLKTVMEFLNEPPSPTKLEIYESAIFAAFMRVRRAPTTAEILEALQANGQGIQERSQVNKALKDLGLGWLIATQKKRSKAVS
jgi:hypothetical protein